MAELPENDRIAGPFIAGAGQTDFPGDFPLIDAPGDPAGSCVVFVRERAGVTTELVVGDFTIPASTEAGFTLRLVVPALEGDRCFVVGRQRQARLREHTSGGAVRSATLEGDARELAARHQEARRDLDRSALAPFGESGPTLPKSAARAGTVAVWSDDGATLLTDRTLTSFDADVAAAEAARQETAAALAAATAKAQAAALALAEILELASGSPDAPSIANKANRDGGNIGEQAAAFRAAIGQANRTSAGLTPAFVVPERGLIYTVPANVRTAVPADLRGLTFSLAEGGGFRHEMAVPVTGVKGSRELTAAAEAADLVAGFGANPWAGVLNAADGSEDIFVEVMSHDGVSQIVLNEPLPFDFAGTLCSRYDDVGGIHLTQGGTRAMVQLLARATGALTARGRVWAAADWRTPPAAETIWAKNAALAAYGESDSAAPIVQTKLFRETAADNIVSGGVPVRPYPSPGGIYVGTHAAGHGADGTLTAGRDGLVLSFTTGAWRPLTTLGGVEFAVSVKDAEGRTIYEAVCSEVLRRHTLILPRAGTYTVSTENLDGGVYNINATDLTLREPGPEGRLIRQRQRVVLGSDSWFHFYDGLAARVMEEKTGAEVVNVSKSGMTTEYHLARHAGDVAPLAPDIVIRGLLLNDYSYAAGAAMQYFEDLNGDEQPLWPAEAVGLEVGLEHWVSNTERLIALDAQCGAQTVMFFVGGTASQASAQTIADWWRRLDPGTPALEYVASPAELAEPASFVNTCGKFTGRPVVSGGRTLFAQGPEPEDGWRNPAEEMAQDALALALNLSDYAAAAAFTIGTDDNADGKSNGISVVGFGAQTGDAYTYSVVDGRQRLEATYAASSGNQRVGYSFTVADDVDYIVAAKVVNATPGQNLAIYTDLPDIVGGVNVTPLTGGENRVGADGTGVVWYRAAAGASGSKMFAIGNERVNGATRTHDVEKVVCVDVAALLADVPSQSGLTNAELAEFVLKLKAV